MRKKVIVLVMMLLLSLSSILIIPKDLKVEASGEGGREGGRDGILGNTEIGSFKQSLNHRISGSNFTALEYGIANTIYIYIKVEMYSKVKCMIYRENELIGETDEGWLGVCERWFPFDLLEPKPVLEKNTEYTLVAWSYGPVKLFYDCFWEYPPGRYDEEYFPKHEPGIPPDPANFTNENKSYSIYCTYEPLTTQVIYYFNDYDVEEAWPLNPEYMVDGNVQTYASTSIERDAELCDSNTCDRFGSEPPITKVEIRVMASYSGIKHNLNLIPLFGGLFHGNTYVYHTIGDSQLEWSPWFDITDDPGGPGIGNWSWIDVRDLDCRVQVGAGASPSSFTLYCSKVEIQVTYIVQ